jgi:hypothetical protein
MNARVRSHLRTVVCLVASVAAACRCRGSDITPLDPAKLSVAPSPLLLGDAYVGETVSGTVSVTDSSNGPGALALAIDAPFTVTPDALEVMGGGSANATVHFMATVPGPVSGSLTLGPLTVPVQANALAVPDCPATACGTSGFDLGQHRCITTPIADGTPCQTACVSGSCHQGVCTGTTVSCDDGDACTVDACNDSTGCFHLPRVCPGNPASCQSPTCDPAVGCGIQQAIDGTLCGPDDCLATQVDVCIGGSCVTRPRPPTGRCANTWVPVSLPPRYSTQVVYELARQRTVLFGGLDPLSKQALDDTWEFDGATWTYRTPASSPPPRYAHAMAYDPRRQRIILFGGHGQGFSQVYDDTWEYDGSTWVQRSPATTPPARYAHAMAFDSARDRLVMFGGSGTITDTWEWNGADWLQRTVTPSPSGSVAPVMAYDPVRQRTVLFGASGNETWEWDGSAWSHLLPAKAPGARDGLGLAWDLARQRVLLVGGLLAGHPQFDVWAWDGNTWASLTPANAPPGADELGLAYDAVRQRLIAVAIDPASSTYRTHELDAQSWHDVTALAPAGRVAPSLAYDSAHQQMVLFGGYTEGHGYFDDTWLWDGGAWGPSAPPLSPSPRAEAAFVWHPPSQQAVLFGGNNAALLADTWLWSGSTWVPGGTMPSARDAMGTYDATRGVVLLFGGDISTGQLADTWTFDGTTWRALTPTTAPTARFAPVAYDEARREVILFAGRRLSGIDGETWAWDGTTWSLRHPPVSPSPREYHALAYDTDRQRVMLFGGEDANSDLQADTWAWDGSTWTQLMPVRSPPPTDAHALAYDPAHHRLMLMGSGGTWLLLP